MDFLVVANKTDKLKKSEREGSFQLIRETLRLGEETEMIPFSAESGEGRDALLRGILSRL
jgi:GTP-binding protein